VYTGRAARARPAHIGALIEKGMGSMTRRLLAILTALTLTATLSSAQTVELVLMHAGLAEEDTDLYLLEHLIDGGLNALFDRGFIGTNERPYAGSQAAFDAYKQRADTPESYVNVIVLILASYPAPGSGPRIPDCSYKVIGVPDGAVRLSGTLQALRPATPSRLDLEKANGAMGGAILSACVPSL
jgi:hypothetical protein